MAEDKKKISVGFQSGQGLSLRIAQDEFDKLVEAIKSRADGWHTIKDEDREIVIRPDQVDFYAVDTSGRETRVGF